jgi:hypothetical protein
LKRDSYPGPFPPCRKKRHRDRLLAESEFSTNGEVIQDCGLGGSAEARPGHEPFLNLHFFSLHLWR